jgi:hypothetical protein
MDREWFRLRKVYGATGSEFTRIEDQKISRKDAKVRRESLGENPLEEWFDSLVGLVLVDSILECLLSIRGIGELGDGDWL